MHSTNITSQSRWLININNFNQKKLVLIPKLIKILLNKKKRKTNTKEQLRSSSNKSRRES